MGRAELEHLIAFVDELIRSGKIPAARKILRETSFRKLPRPARLPLSALARRAGLSLMAVAFLQPVVRPSGRRVPSPASIAELAEYAAALIAVGAIAEGLELLARGDSPEEPQVLLYRSFGLMAQWNYHPTIALLERYVAHRSLDDYQRLVGQTNLASALVVERQFDRARPLIAEIVTETDRRGARLLQAKAEELFAQCAVLQGDWPEARLRLSIAVRNLPSEGGTHELLLAKWSAVVDRLERPASRRGFRRLAEVRKRAGELGHWETVRQCDLYEAIASRDHSIALHVYFGTPYRAFRERLSATLGFALSIPDEFLLHLGAGSKVTTSFDLRTGQCVGRRARLKPGQTIHRLLTALTQDFYRPARLAALHFAIYPSEHFNVWSSGERVHRVIRRAREWLKHVRIPVKIAWARDGYRIAARARVELKLPTPERSLKSDRNHLLLQSLAFAMGEEMFTAEAAAAAVGTSHRNVLFLLKAALASGALERRGVGRATRYWFAATEIALPRKRAIAK